MIGLVTLMLSKPAMQSKKPKKPVIRLPQKKTVPSQVPLLIMLLISVGSPWMTTAGKRKIAEPAFVHHASCIVELLQ